MIGSPESATFSTLHLIERQFEIMAVSRGRLSR